MRLYGCAAQMYCLFAASSGSACPIPAKTGFPKRKEMQSSAIKSNIVQITLSKMNGIIEAQLVK